MPVKDGENSVGDTKKEILALLRRNPKPFVTASEVAEEMNLSRQAAHRHLSELHGQSKVNREKVGAKAVVWWI